MLSILVGHSFFLNFDSKQVQRAKPYPPLATLQAATMLRHAGHRVSLFDAMLALDVRDYAQQLEAERPQLVLLYEDNFNFLSKMCLGRMRQAACEMIERARSIGARVIVAGSDASDAPAVYLGAGADVVLLGEGLSALLALLPRMEAAPGANLDEWVHEVPGTAVMSQGQLHRSSGRPLAWSPANDEVPAWDLVDMDRYRRAWLHAHGHFSLNMAASKGCSFSCTWCAKPIWGQRYLQRRAVDVAAEMAHLKERYKPDHIWFADDIFGMRADWVRSFADALRSRDGGIGFTIQTRADLISSAMASALADAGCREAWIGAESGSQRVLDAMDKGTTVAEILTARNRLREHGVRVGFFIQIGYLGEQLEDLLATRALIEHAQPDDIGVSVSYPLPGTRFHDIVKDQLGDKTHWDDSNDLSMMFRGTYGSAFYREWRDLLHEQVRVQQLNRPETAEVHDDARRTLERRWDACLAMEGRHRTFALSVAAAGLRA